MLFFGSQPLNNHYEPTNSNECASCSEQIARSDLLEYQLGSELFEHTRPIVWSN